MPDNDADDIAQDIANSATSPQSATVDGNSVTSRSIDDKIKAEAHTRQRSVTVNQLFGNRTRLVNGPRQ